jgi:SAM-dependent methyltransferase
VSTTDNPAEEQLAGEPQAQTHASIADIEALRLQAETAEAKGAWQETAAARAAVVEFAEATFQDHFLHARALLYAGATEDAARLVAKLPNEHEDRLLPLKADVQERLNNFEEVQRLWLEARGKGTSEYWSLFGQARALVGLGQIGAAKVLMDNAVVLPEVEAQGKQFAQDLDERVISAAAAEHAAKSSSSPSGLKATELENHLDTLRRLATELEDCSSWKQAAALRAEIATVTNHSLWDDFLHARALLYDGRLDEAKPLITALAENSSDPAVLTLKADFLERAEDYSQAILAWATAARAGFSRYWCLFGQARALRALGHLNDAKRVMAEALALPDGEATGKQFAEELDQADRPSGALVDLHVAGKAELAPFHAEILIEELFVRLGTGENIASNAQSIALADALAEMLTEKVEVSENRFSMLRIRNLFNTFYTQLRVKPKFPDSSFLDVGSGSHNPLALSFLFILLGARQAFSVDLQSMQDEGRAARALARQADIMLTDPERIVGEYLISPDDIRKNLRGFDLPKLRSGNLDGLDKTRLCFLQQSASALSLEKSSIDALTSNSFLEHVAEVDDVIIEMARVTKQGGWGIHSIDGADHGRYWNASTHPLEFLCSKRTGMVSGSNRIRPLEFSGLFEKHGFQVEQIIPHDKVEVDQDLRARLASPWREMSDEVLEVIGAIFVVRRV